MPRPQRKHAKVLHVEGPDDKEVVYQFCNRRGIDNRELFHVEDSPVEGRLRGYEGLRARVSEELKADRDTIGIVVDADADLPSRWQSLRDVLVRHYEQRDPKQFVPEHLEPGGLIVESKAWWQKRCGIWVMPDNARGGMLEDFLLTLIADSDVLQGHARQVVAALPETRFIQDTARRPRSTRGSPGRKSRERRWAWRSRAATSTLAQRFHDWLVALFKIPSAST
jgi:hypothetical protein